MQKMDEYFLSQVRRRKSPERPLRQRPSSDILTVRWADSTLVTEGARPGTLPRRTRRVSRERPKSDLGGRQAISDALQQFQTNRKNLDSIGNLPDFSSTQAKARKDKMKPRRMSTPHPIKTRQGKESTSQKPRTRLKKSRSAPDLTDDIEPKKRRIILEACSLQAGDLAIQPEQLYETSDDEYSQDTVSLGGASTGSSQSGKRIDEIYEDHTPTYAEALWNHVTLDGEELAFGAGEVIEVLDTTDKDWWYGVIGEKMGWFPASFVRIRACQEDTAEDFILQVKEGSIDPQTAYQKYSSTLLSKDQARANVVNEIIHAEREYVKHLRDVIVGYVDKARRRPEMFSPDCLHRIFSNIEDIFKFSNSLLDDLESRICPLVPYKSEVGMCFIEKMKGFEIYSEYCNNHPFANQELNRLQRDKKYQHFFEACRLLQQMIEIPLEGFLLTPVQKICKYPLQLKELLKYTRPEHPDYIHLQQALDGMTNIAKYINERKRKMESLEKLALWQEEIVDWEGPDLIEHSSELIFSGEMTKVNSGGWHQDRVFFLFDHQIIYCKKDLLWRDVLAYRGRIQMDCCKVHHINDGKDLQFNTSVKNAFRLYDSDKDKWFLIYCKTAVDKERWTKAFREEREIVRHDRECGFKLKDFHKKALAMYQAEKGKDKKSRITVSHKNVIQGVPKHGSLPRGVQSQERYQKKGGGGWFPFLRKKNKR